MRELVNKMEERKMEDEEDEEEEKFRIEINCWISSSIPTIY